MSELDDAELRDRLRRLSGPNPDVETALAGVSVRARKARHQQIVARVGAAAVVLVVGVGAVLAMGNGGDRAVIPADTGLLPTLTVPPTLPGPTTPTVPTTPPTPTATTTPDTTATTAPIAGPPVGPTTSPAPTTAGTTVPSEAPGPTTEPATSNPVPADDEQTIPSTGGSIRVRLSEGALSLRDTQPVAGYTPKVEDDSPDRVRVRFESQQRSYRITVTIRGGRISSDVTESGGSGGPG